MYVFPCSYLQMFSVNFATEHMRALRQSLIYFVQQIKTKNMASWFTCHGLRFHSAPGSALRGIPESPGLELNDYLPKRSVLIHCCCCCAWDSAV